MRNYISEFLGTYAIVFFGTGAVVVNQQTNDILGHLGVCVVWGLVVMVMIYALGNISGAHFNPAVTLGFWVAKRFPIAEVVPYSVSQFAGAAAASATISILFPTNELLGATLPTGTIGQALTLEVMLMFFFMLVIMNVAHGSKEQGLFAGLAIGFFVLLIALFAGPISGASINPARSFGPALVSGHFSHLWIYFLAPYVGAILAVFTWQYLTIQEKKN